MATSMPPYEQEPLACRIQDPAQLRQRQTEVTTLFKGATSTQELTDGYALSFPSEARWATKLLEFILFENECCPFYTFELIFEHQHGPLWLRWRGPEGTKDILKNSFAELFA